MVEYKVMKKVYKESWQHIIGILVILVGAFIALANVFLPRTKVFVVGLVIGVVGLILMFTGKPGECGWVVDEDFKITKK